MDKTRGEIWMLGREGKGICQNLPENFDAALERPKNWSQTGCCRSSRRYCCLASRPSKPSMGYRLGSGTTTTTTSSSCQSPRVRAPWHHAVRSSDWFCRSFAWKWNRFPLGREWRPSRSSGTDRWGLGKWCGKRCVLRARSSARNSRRCSSTNPLIILYAKIRIKHTPCN